MLYRINRVVSFMIAALVSHAWSSKAAKFPGGGTKVPQRSIHPLFNGAGIRSIEHMAVGDPEIRTAGCAVK